MFQHFHALLLQLTSYLKLLASYRYQIIMDYQYAFSAKTKLYEFQHAFAFAASTLQDAVVSLVWRVFLLGPCTNYRQNRETTASCCCPSTSIGFSIESSTEWSCSSLLCYFLLTSIYLSSTSMFQHFHSLTSHTSYLKLLTWCQFQLALDLLLAVSTVPRRRLSERESHAWVLGNQQKSPHLIKTKSIGLNCISDWSHREQLPSAPTTTYLFIAQRIASTLVTTMKHSTVSAALFGIVLRLFFIHAGLGSPTV